MTRTTSALFALLIAGLSFGDVAAAQGGRRAAPTTSTTPPAGVQPLPPTRRHWGVHGLADDLQFNALGK